MDMNKIKTTATVAMTKVSKYAPEILTAGSVASEIATPILAARAWQKNKLLVAAMEKEKAQLEDQEASPSEMKKFKLDYAGKFVRCWAPTALVGTAGIGCTLGHYGVMKKRYSAAVAATTAVAGAFQEYRNRVIEDLGKEKDMEYRTGVVRKEGVTITKDEEGNEVMTECDGVTFPETPSIYSCWFDAESAPNDYKANLRLNLDFLTAQERYANNYLNSHGVLFLNDVRKWLGMKPTKEGQIVGWVKGKDTYVDFGIYNPLCSANKKALELSDDDVIHDGFFLDFNVQGVVYENLPSGLKLQEHEDQWPQAKQYD